MQNYLESDQRTVTLSVKYFYKEDDLTLLIPAALKKITEPASVKKYFEIATKQATSVFKQPAIFEKLALAVTTTDTETLIDPNIFFESLNKVKINLEEADLTVLNKDDFLNRRHYHQLSSKNAYSDPSNSPYLTSKTIADFNKRDENSKAKIYFYSPSFKSVPKNLTQAWTPIFCLEYPAEMKVDAENISEDNIYSLLMSLNEKKAPYNLNRIGAYNCDKSKKKNSKEISVSNLHTKSTFEGFRNSLITYFGLAVEQVNFVSSIHKQFTRIDLTLFTEHLRKAIQSKTLNLKLIATEAMEAFFQAENDAKEAIKEEAKKEAKAKFEAVNKPSEPELKTDLLSNTKERLKPRAAPIPETVDPIIATFYPTLMYGLKEIRNFNRSIHSHYDKSATVELTKLSRLTITDIANLFFPHNQFTEQDLAYLEQLEIVIAAPKGESIYQYKEKVDDSGSDQKIKTNAKLSLRQLYLLMRCNLFFHAFAQPQNDAIGSWEYGYILLRAISSRNDLLKVEMVPAMQDLDSITKLESVMRNGFTLFTLQKFLVADTLLNLKTQDALYLGGLELNVRHAAQHVLDNVQQLIAQNHYQFAEKATTGLTERQTEPSDMTLHDDFQQWSQGLLQLEFSASYLQPISSDFYHVSLPEFSTQNDSIRNCLFKLLILFQLNRLMCQDSPYQQIPTELNTFVETMTKARDSHHLDLALSAKYLQISKAGNHTESEIYALMNRVLLRLENNQLAASAPSDNDLLMNQLENLAFLPANSLMVSGNILREFMQYTEASLQKVLTQNLRKRKLEMDNDDIRDQEGLTPLQKKHPTVNKLNERKRKLDQLADEDEIVEVSAAKRNKPNPIFSTHQPQINDPMDYTALSGEPSAEERVNRLIANNVAFGLRKLTDKSDESLSQQSFEKYVEENMLRFAQDPNEVHPSPTTIILPNIAIPSYKGAWHHASGLLISITSAFNGNFVGCETGMNSNQFIAQELTKGDNRGPAWAEKIKKSNNRIELYLDFTHFHDNLFEFDARSKRIIPDEVVHQTLLIILNNACKELEVRIQKPNIVDELNEENRQFIDDQIINIIAKACQKLNYPAFYQRKLLRCFEELKTEIKPNESYINALIRVVKLKNKTSRDVAGQQSAANEVLLLPTSYPHPVNEAIKQKVLSELYQDKAEEIEADLTALRQHNGDILGVYVNPMTARGLFDAASILKVMKKMGLKEPLLFTYNNNGVLKILAREQFKYGLERAKRALNPRISTEGTHLTAYVPAVTLAQLTTQYLECLKFISIRLMPFIHFVPGQLKDEFLKLTITNGYQLQLLPSLHKCFQQMIMALPPEIGNSNYALLSRVNKLLVNYQKNFQMLANIPKTAPQIALSSQPSQLATSVSTAAAVQAIPSTQTIMTSVPIPIAPGSAIQSASQKMTALTTEQKADFRTIHDSLQSVCNVWRKAAHALSGNNASAENIETLAKLKALFTSQEVMNLITSVSIPATAVTQAPVQPTATAPQLSTSTSALFGRPSSPPSAATRPTSFYAAQQNAKGSTPPRPGSSGSGSS